MTKTWVEYAQLRHETASSDSNTNQDQDPRLEFFDPEFSDEEGEVLVDFGNELVDLGLIHPNSLIDNS